MVGVFKLVSSVLGCQGLEPCSLDYRRVGKVIAPLSFVVYYVSVCPSVRTISVVSTVQVSVKFYFNCVGSMPLCTLITFYYLSRLYTTYSNSCELLQRVNYATRFGLWAIITQV